VLDLSGILYLSSRAWGILATAAADLERREGQLLLTGLNAEVADVHAMLGFEEVLPAYSSLQEALQNLHGDDAAEDDSSEEPEEPDTEAAEADPEPARRHRRPRRRSEAKKRRRLSRKRAVRPVALPNVSAPQPVNGSRVDFDPNAAPETEGEWESLRIISGCVGPRGEVRLLGVEGILDTVSARKFSQVLESRMQQGDARFLVDLSRTEFISSAGWGVFASALTDLRAQRGDLKLFGMGRELKHIFGLLGLNAVLQSFDVMGEALEAFGLVAEVEDDAASESHPAQGSTPDIEVLPDVLPEVIPEEEPTAARIGRLQVTVQPFGSSGNATRLVMEGELDGSEVKELTEWLRAAASTELDRNRLLLLDARRVHAADETHWLQLLERDVRQTDNWGRVHMLRPQTHCPLPMGLALPVHETLEEALQAFQNRSTATLRYARIEDPKRFAADSTVRREGWIGYKNLLRQAQGDKEST